jgi:hypothetical protein
VQITFQIDDFMGRIAYKVSGNCSGLNIINYFDVSNILDKFHHLILNDCNIRLHSDNIDFDEYKYWYSVVLKNCKGEELLTDSLDISDLENIIVAVEIIDCEEVSENE